MVVINYWAVLVAAIVSMVVGSLWYGPFFGKQFMRAMGMDMWSPEKQAEMKKSMMGAYIGQFVASLVMFFTLAWYVNTSIHMGVWGGVANAFGIWLGFIVPIKLGDALWGGSWTLFWLNVSSNLVTLLAAGAIICAWQ
jgi:hypothetical protein